MKESDESLIHRKAKALEGTYTMAVPWGNIAIKLEAIPNYAGGKGCPDEILRVAVEFPAFGSLISLSVPILIEGEKAGTNAAKVDLDKFCERSISGEQSSYLKIPMMVIGGEGSKRLKPVFKPLLAQFGTTQVPIRIIRE